ncbi:MAG: phosphoribosylformylglycinamidine synthase subunit PurS [Gemmatimonadaceae bacterium]|nr:phosphoribosylformylglycinamidine synthase subunit PurS [Gemmatimonadaceae bacterium]
MKLHRVAVHIVPRSGLLDPQGKAVADALVSLGFTDVRNAHVGRHIVIETMADNAEAAKKSIRAMCEKLLANPVTEDFAIESAEPA